MKHIIKALNAIIVWVGIYLSPMVVFFIIFRAYFPNNLVLTVILSGALFVWYVFALGLLELEDLAVAERRGYESAKRESGNINAATSSVTPALDVKSKKVIQEALKDMNIGPGTVKFK